MTARLVERCGICGSARLDLVLSLGSSPPTCVMAPVGRRQASENHHPLELLRCHDCTLVQLSVAVDPRVMFPRDYPYASGNSRALHDNFEDLARQASGWLGGLCADDLVVDIGANDGTLLSKFDCRTVGVEPTRQGLKGDMSAVWQSFFSEQVAREIVADYGEAQVVTACNVLAHVEDVGDVMRGIGTLLADDGILIAENHDLASVVDGQWDTVYHEHLRFYDPHSFNRLLEAYGLGCREWQSIPTHGGSFRMLAKRGVGVNPPPREYDFDLLASNVGDARNNLRSNLDHLPPAWGIGATARATTIINYCGLDAEDIACVCEVPGSDKIGHYIPGTRIPVVDEARLFEEQPSHAVLFSWHLADKIVPKLRERGYAGEIILPLPTLADGMSDRHEDARGVIQDLLGQVDSVTHITTKKGAIRGNHVHHRTDQWTYVVSGRILSARGEDEPREVGDGGLRMILEPKGVPHAWKALEDTVCLVFTKGPRSGDQYESDTERLDEPLLT